MSQKESIKVWYDKQINLGSPDWQEAIKQAIEMSACMLCLASPAFIDSHWTRQELAFAEKLERKVFMALIDGDNLPFGYLRTQYADLRRGDEKGEMPKLIKAIQAYLQRKVERKSTTAEFTTFPSAPAQKPVLQPPDFTTTTFVHGLLEAAADLITLSTHRGRASLLWVDYDELYIAGATERYLESEMRLRLNLNKKKGFAGEVWENGLKSGSATPVIDYPRKLTPEEMRSRWGFEDELIEHTRRMGVIISLPIFNALGEMTGILSIDSPEELTEAELDTGNLQSKARNLREKIAGALNGRKPISFRKQRNLSSLIRTARLIPPLDIRARAAIFLIDRQTEELYMLIGSEEYIKLWEKEKGLRYTREQGLVGRAWKQNTTQYDNRSGGGKGRIYLKETLNMTKTQIEVATDIKSILTTPIRDPNTNDIIGVFEVNCPVANSGLEVRDNQRFFEDLAWQAGKILAYDERSESDANK